jgi:NADH-quinone oxidoreductase subunit H
LLLGWGLSEGLVHVSCWRLLGAVILAVDGDDVRDLPDLVRAQAATGRIQDRLGPNRVGPFGLFQTFADMGKIFTKEMITPTGVDKVPYNLAPVLSVAAVLLLWAVIPLARTSLAQTCRSACCL